MVLKDVVFSIMLLLFWCLIMECMLVNVKVGCFYFNNVCVMNEVWSRGFDNVVVCDMFGNVVELMFVNIFMVKDGVVYMFVLNGMFFNGIMW